MHSKPRSVLHCLVLPPGEIARLCWKRRDDSNCFP